MRGKFHYRASRLKHGVAACRWQLKMEEKLKEIIGKLQNSLHWSLMSSSELLWCLLPCIPEIWWFDAVFNFRFVVSYPLSRFSDFEFLEVRDNFCRSSSDSILICSISSISAMLSSKSCANLQRSCSLRALKVMRTLLSTFWQSWMQCG